MRWDPDHGHVFNAPLPKFAPDYHQFCLIIYLANCWFKVLINRNIYITVLYLVRAQACIFKLIPRNL